MDTDPSGLAKKRHEWVLVDHQARLLLLGNRVFRATSLNKSLDQVERVLLAPRLHEAIDNASDASYQETISEHTLDDVSWVVEVHRCVAAFSQNLVAVLGVIYKKGDLPPIAPLVGTWEWHLVPSQSPKAFWDANLYRLYEIAPEAQERALGVWSAARWNDLLVAPHDKRPMQMKIAAAIQEADENVLHSISYEIITGYGSDRRGRKQLRLAGRTYKEDNGIIWLRGISHEEPEGTKNTSLYTPGLEYARSSDMLRASEDLAHEVALCTVDLEYGDMIETSPGWAFQEIVYPNDGQLKSIVLGDDFPKFDAYLRVVSRYPEVSQEPLLVHLLKKPNEYRLFLVRATGVRSGHDTGRYVIFRATLA